MASYFIRDYTDTSVTIVVQGLTAGVSTYKYFIRLTSDPSDSTVSTGLITAGASTAVRTFSGLQPNTSYTANVSVDGAWLGATTFTTAKSGSTRPSDWSWQSTIGSGKTVKISASEWNNFCSRINAFRTYKGLSSYSFTSATQGADISAAIVNQAWTAINAISGHGTMPSKAVSGGPMYASFFTGLASALNAIS